MERPAEELSEEVLRTRAVTLVRSATDALWAGRVSMVDMRRYGDAINKLQHCADLVDQALALVDQCWVKQQAR